MKKNNNIDLSLNETNKEETKMNNNNVEMSLSTNHKEELTMRDTDKLILNKIKEEREAMENIYRFTNKEVSVDELFELLGNLTHEQLLDLDVRCHEAFEDSLMFGDEETTPGYERIGDVFEIIEQIIDSKVCYLDSYYFDELPFDDEEETTMKMDLQFFAIKIEEETEMLEQVQRFNDIAKQIEEIDAVGGDVYVGGVKVSWEAVKQFIYGLDEDELKLLAYSNKPEIPAELEAYAIYLLEAEKAWDNELTMQNSYFNSKKHLSMDLQFFASKSEEEVKMKNEREIESLLSEYFQEEVSLISKHEELVKFHEQTWKESVREPRVKLGVSTKNKTNKKKEEIKMNKMSKRNARKVIYVIALVLIVVFNKQWFNFVDMLIPKSSMDGAEIFLVAPLWISSYLFLAVQSFRWLGGFFITLIINLKELVK